MQLSEQEIIRRQSLEELLKRGINPYPADLFTITTTAHEIHEKFPSQPESFKEISLAGRMMTGRRLLRNVVANCAHIVSSQNSVLSTSFRSATHATDSTCMG